MDADVDASMMEGWERLGRILSDTVDLDELFRSVCREVAEGFGFSRALLATVEPGTGQLVARAGYEAGIAAVVYAALRRLYRVPLHADESGRVSAAAWCVLRQEQVYVPDATAYSFRPDRTYQVSLLAKALGTSEYVLTPLVHRGRSLGMLAVDKRGADRPIEEPERRLLRAVASVVAAGLGPRLPALSATAPPAATEAAAPPSPRRSLGAGRASGAEGPVSEELADGVFHALPMGALVVGHDGRVLRANRAALDLLGREPRQVLRLPWVRTLGAAGPAETRPLLHALGGSPGDAVPHRLRLRREDGGSTPVDAWVLPLEEPPGPDDAPGAGEPGLPGRRLVLLEDVSEQVEADRLREAFLCMLVHDLKTPLQSVAGFAELLLMGRVGRLNEEQEEFVRRIEAAGGRMLELVEEILTFRRLGWDGAGIEPVPRARPVEELLAGLAGKAAPRPAAPAPEGS